MEVGPASGIPSPTTVVRFVNQIIRVRVPGGQRYSNHLLLGPRQVRALLVDRNYLDLLELSRVAFLGDGAPIHQGGALYLPKVQYFDAQRWVSVDGSVVRGYRTLTLDFQTALSGFDIYVKIMTERI